MGVKILEKDMDYNELMNYLSSTEKYRLLRTEEIDDFNYKELSYSYATMVHCEGNDAGRMFVYSPTKGKIITVPKTFKIKVLLVKTDKYLRLLDNTVMEHISIYNDNITTWVNDVCEIFKLQHPIEEGDTVMVGKRRKA